VNDTKNPKPSNAIKARSKAINRLIEMHQSDFSVLLAEERGSLGLSADPERERKERRIKQLEERLQALKAEL